MGRAILKGLSHYTTLLQRAAWVLVTAAHVPALVRSWQGFLTPETGSSGMAGCAILTLVVLFLLLKVIGVPCLRFRTDRRSLLAIGLVIGLLHIDVLRPHIDVSVIPEYAPIVATTLIAAGLEKLRRARATAHTQSGPSSNFLSNLLRCHDTVWFDCFRPHCWVRASHLFLLRAPPA